MLYLNKKNILEVGVDWLQLTDIIRQTVNDLANNDFKQPLKPYLRYGDLKNRIIAMPAYLGGEVNQAGIKWIASFPDNINKGIPRANSVVILNNAETGVVESVINTSYVSVLRTSAVSGLVIECLKKARQLKNLKVGIIGFGPIGQGHLEMCQGILGDLVDQYCLYDIRPVINPEEINTEFNESINVCKSWEEAYCDCDIVICSTVPSSPYIDKPSKKGALILNVSLRDFKTDTYDYLRNNIIVDNWKEVCRENTTIDIWNKYYNLQEDDVNTIVELVKTNCLEAIPNDENIMFNPMGMAIFDIAVGKYYFDRAKELGVGMRLE